MRVHSRSIRVNSRGALALGLLVALMVGVPVLAQSGGPFSLTWSTLAGGGSTQPSTGGSFSLSGTAGQADTQAMTGGPFSLVGGFWAGRP